MTKNQSSRAIVPPSFFAKLLLPFAVPMLVTFALIILVGEGWPRNIAPGSGLKLYGFGATVLTSLMVWQFTIRSINDKRVHKMAGLICAVVGLMGWPVWSVGVLPSLNGISLGPQEVLRMTLERTEVTTVSRSNKLNHWAWLRPATRNTPLAAGRYFIPEQTYQQWQDQQPIDVTITIARGLLGAQVVTDFE